MDHSPESVEASGLPSAFPLNHFSLRLPLASSVSQQVPSSLSRSSEPLKRNGKLVRPSTASAVKEKFSLLPVAPNAITVDVATPDLVVGGRESLTSSAISSRTQGDEPKFTSVKQAISERDSQLALSGSLPSLFDGGASGDIRSMAGSTEIVEHQYDWATFISAYAAGQWDPLRTPNPPRSYAVHCSYSHSVPSVSAESASRAWTVLATQEALRPKLIALPSFYHEEASDTKPSYSSSVFVPSRKQSSPANIRITSPDEENPPLTAPASKARHPTIPSILPASARQSLRNSLSEWRVAGPDRNSNPSLDSDAETQPSNPQLTTTAATLRWAGAGVNLAPLALPSPEHELTDPMRGVTAAIPGSHNEAHQVMQTLTPGGMRKTRLASFWQGTQDVECNYYGQLATIDGSPSEIAVDTDSEYLSQPTMPFPASAPLVRSVDKPSDDYFCLHTTSDEVHIPLREGPPIVRRSSTPLDIGTVSVPALPRRVCLTRQISSPLPSSTRLERYLPGRSASYGTEPFKASRAAKEEQMYAELGYLAPPTPPDEWERRRALNKFNIWCTGPDLNFDRIAHLTKLVFNTKGVFVSLVDGNEQWFKSQWGMKVDTCGRAHAFCAHAILQRGDEPMVVLDTHLDWRFAKHPLVIGHPRIRFYAGAPLRTQEGYNIGTLSVIDEVPREEFSPRQRHTLKEFAAIVMREMELWRDKIQLRVRDRIQTSMEQFSRECLEIETEVGHREDKQGLNVGASMDRVYDRAAKLVKRTLDVEEVIVMDVSHCEVLDTMGEEGAVSVAIHHGDPSLETTTRWLSQEEYSMLTLFFSKYPEGKISEGIVPSCFRAFLPTRIQYALTVPIFNIDKRPFALLCAYNASSHTNRFLEGHELSYLRAIGVIILSAVLKRRMILADKAKSLFISNISHELRTPLHGILAAAELLTDTSLNANQTSFLQTVQACGTSLVETVNHVLDFTKLSGSSKNGGVENVIAPTKVNLMQLVEEAIDGCWIGHRARMSAQSSEIGSVYSPPTTHQSNQPSQPDSGDYVETVVEVGLRKKGWLVKCERGGIRRVLMNLLGNSLKFTSDGFVHVGLRQLPTTDGIPDTHIKIELSVLDTGKGISQNFLKNHLFHPFSQENPLQTGTGLGLAIVNNIVNSPSVGGKIEVWSEEGVGTEIKIIFTAEAVNDDDDGDDVGFGMGSLNFNDLAHPPTVSLVAFKPGHKGTNLLRQILSNYLVSWWGFVLQPDGNDYGDLIIINENPALVSIATNRKDTSRPFIILSSSLGDPKVMAVASDHERIGGFCRILYKPGGPSRLQSVLKVCLNILQIKRRHDRHSPGSELVEPRITDNIMIKSSIQYPNEWPSNCRRHAEETDILSRSEGPSVESRGIGACDTAKLLLHGLPSTLGLDESRKLPKQDPTLDLHASIGPLIPIGSGGCLLKSSIGSIDAKDFRYRVLVVEDNSILRNLLIKWLTSKGHEFRDAVDGREGVEIYESDGPFDVVLLDLSMPRLDGIGATAEIRQFESKCHNALIGQADRLRAGILALTGMSSLEDKRKAFAAGVDGYLVKPVAFKTLEEMFRQLSIENHS